MNRSQLSDFAANHSMLKDLDYSILQQCIHCGMCLPTCPTYDATKLEISSPRGRIALMRAVADGKLETSQTFAEEMYFCLGCLACETACPAGVNYNHLIETARVEVEHAGALDSVKRNLLRNFFLSWLFRSRWRLRFAARLLWFYQRLGIQALLRRSGAMKWLPKTWRDLEALTPTISDSFTSLDRVPALSSSRRVGLLIGCIQDVAFAHVNRDTIYVLEQNGCEIVLPLEQACCGSLHAHNGDLEGARAQARRNLDAFDVDLLDAIIINAAGCGSQMKHYDRLLENDPVYMQKAKVWSKKVRDITEYLVEIGFRKPQSDPASHGTALLAYHEACHLVHGQKISAQPKEILKSLPHYTWVELPEAAWCCGSAGIYNITHPDMATTLLERKISHIMSSGAHVLASANPGCTLQILAGLKKQGMNVRVEHPVSLLADAYRNE